MSHESRDQLQPASRSGTIPSGPLQRRLLGCVQPLEDQTGVQAGLGVHAPVAFDDDSYATLGLLDGTVIARLLCGAALGRAAIGRSSLSDIRIQDSWVHRVHAHIDWDTSARAHVIEHAGGVNGTFVNLQRVTAATRLIDGARVRIGKTELVYRRVR